MKKQEIKKLLKPLIEECIKEVIFEEGVLSGLIKEVMSGLTDQQPIVENNQTQQDFSRQRSVELQQESQQKLKERKRKLEETLGGKFKGVFENVDPISKPGNPSSEGGSKSPISGYAPSDAGVDISGIMAIAGGSNWKNMI
jgi:hypothetical protein